LFKSSHSCTHNFKPNQKSGNHTIRLHKKCNPFKGKILDPCQLLTILCCTYSERAISLLYHPAIQFQITF
jgi:hypothetical protein